MQQDNPFWGYPMFDHHSHLFVRAQVQYWSHPAVSRVLRLDAFGRCEFLGAFDGQNAAAAKAAEEEAAVEAVVEEEEKAPGSPSAGVPFGVVLQKLGFW